MARKRITSEALAMMNVPAGSPANQRIIVNVAPGQAWELKNVVMGVTRGNWYCGASISHDLSLGNPTSIEDVINDGSCWAICGNTGLSIPMHDYLIAGDQLLRAYNSGGSDLQVFVMIVYNLVDVERTLWAWLRQTRTRETG